MSWKGDLIRAGIDSDGDNINIFRGDLTVYGALVFTGGADFGGSITFEDDLTFEGQLLSTGTVAKGIDFTDATLTQGWENAFFACGSGNGGAGDQHSVTLTDFYIPIQVNMVSIANPDDPTHFTAAMFRTDISTADQAKTLCNPIAVRAKIAKNIYGASGISVDMEVSDDIEVDAESLKGGYFAISGDGAVTCTGDCNVLEAVYKQTTGGSGIDNVAQFHCNASGCSVADLLHLRNVAGTVTNGLNISGAVTTGILIASGTTNAISITGTPTNADLLLHNGATFMNGAAGTLDITEATITLVGATAVTMTTGTLNVQPAADGNAVINLKSDANAHLTITQTNGAGVTFLSTSDGTAGFLFDGGIVTLDGGATLDNTTSADILNVTEATITLTAATAINLTSAVSATTIAVTGLPTGENTPVLGIGNLGTPLVDTSLLDSLFFQSSVSTGTNKTAGGSSTCAGYFRAINTAAVANARLQSVIGHTHVAYNCYDAYGVQGHLSVDGNATATSSGNMVGGSFKATVNETFTATGHVAAIMATLDGAGTVSGAHNGIYIDGVVACDNGIDMLATGTMGVGINLRGDITTAISISAVATTGLSMTGTYTNGIDLTGATLTQAVDNALFSIGSISGAKTVDIDASYIPFQIKLESTTNPGEQISMGAAYMSNAITTVDQANLQLATLMLRTTLNYNCYDAYGVQSHLTVAGDSVSTSSGNVTPGSFKLTVDSGKTLTASASGILVTIDGAGTVTGQHSGIWIDTAVACDHALRIDGHSALTDAFYMSGTITNAFVFEANGSGIVHGGTAAANVAGYVKIKAAGTSYRIPYLIDSDA